MTHAPCPKIALCLLLTCIIMLMHITYLLMCKALLGTKKKIDQQIVRGSVC